MKRVASFLCEFAAAVYCLCLVLALWWLVSAVSGTYTPPWMVSPFLVVLCGSCAVLLCGAVCLALVLARKRKRPRGRRLGYVSRETIQAISPGGIANGIDAGGSAENRCRDDR